MASCGQSSADDESNRLLSLHLRHRNCRALVPVKKKTIVAQSPERLQRESPVKSLGKLRSSLQSLNAVVQEGDTKTIVDKLRQANQLCAQLQQSAAHVDSVLRTLATKVQTPPNFKDIQQSSFLSPPKWNMVGRFTSYDTFDSDSVSDHDSVDLSTSLACAIEEISNDDENNGTQPDEDGREVVITESEDAEEDDETIDETIDTTPESRVGIARADYGLNQQGEFPVSPLNLMINTSPHRWQPLGSKDSRRSSLPEMKKMQFGLASISERLFDSSAEQDT